MHEQDTRVDTVLVAVLASEGQLTEQEAAEMVFLSPRRLRGIFRARMGTSFRTHCYRVRMECARRQLRETRKTIDDIAEDLGYSSRAEFEHSFKRFYGATPAGDRKMTTQAISNTSEDSLNFAPGSAEPAQEASVCIPDTP